MKVKLLSRVRLFSTLWMGAHQASLSLGFSRQEYHSGLPFPTPGDLPEPGIEPGSHALQADALPSGPPGKHYIYERAGVQVSGYTSPNGTLWRRRGQDRLGSGKVSVMLLHTRSEQIT